MTVKPEVISALFDGWRAYQQLMVNSLQALNESQLSYRAAENLRSVEEIACHIIAARAYWFCGRMDETGEEFEAFAGWGRDGDKTHSPEELVGGLVRTWDFMHLAIARWSPAEWEQTWPGRRPHDPKIITRDWVLWHLIEHDLHHGGEISLTLGTHGMEGLGL